MPPGGEGWYFFSAFHRCDADEANIFDMTLNDDVICTTVEDMDGSTGGDAGQGVCSAVVHAIEGNSRFVRVAGSQSQ